MAHSASFLDNHDLAHILGWVLPYHSLIKKMSQRLAAGQFVKGNSMIESTNVIMNMRIKVTANLVVLDMSPSQNTSVLYSPDWPCRSFEQSTEALASTCFVLLK